MPLPILVRKRSPEKESPAFFKPPHKNKIEKHGSLPSASKEKLTKKPPEYYILPGNIGQVSPGCIVWLPAKHILRGAIVDGRLHENAFNYPAVILSIPSPLTRSSIVEFAIMTSCGGRTLRQASKLRHKSQLLRVKTAAHPYARIDLNLKREKGTAREYLYVNLIRYMIQLCTLGLYERQLGEYCLTNHRLKKLAGLYN